MIGLSLGQLIASQKPYIPYRRSGDPEDMEDHAIIGTYKTVGEAMDNLWRKGGKVGILVERGDSGRIQRFAHTYAKRQNRAIFTKTYEGVVWIRDRRAEGCK